MSMYPPPPGHAGQPGYGWGPPPPPRRRGPKKLWYVIGATLLAAGLLGVGAGVATIVDVMAEQPDDAHIITAGESTRVPFEAGETRVIFAGTEAAEHDINCDVASREISSGVQIQQFSGDLTLNRWQAVFTVDVEQPGEYSITCTGAPADTFGVGGDVSVGQFVAGVFGLVVGIGVAVLGIITLIITAVLRHRRSF